MKRIFAAIKVHPNAKLMDIYDSLKSACEYDRITWVNPDNMHITLKFFGETEEEWIPSIQERLKEISEDHPVFDITLKGIGVFGSRYKPRVVWIGIEKNPDLINLGQHILDEMEPLGFEKDRQNFVPHLTLGRIKYVDDKKRFFALIQSYRDTPISAETVKEIVLYESVLSRTGPVYDVVDKFLLQFKPGNT
jgi:2'-5' RNA ligase